MRSNATLGISYTSGGGTPVSFYIDIIILLVLLFEELDKTLK